MNSIRRTLLLTLLIGMGVVMLLGAYATYRVARSEANSIFDYYLRQIALSFRDHRFLLDNTVTIPDEKNFDFVIRVWNASGVTVYYSRPHRSLPNLTKLGYSTVTTPEGTWRVFALQYLDETIEVAQPIRVRDTQAANAALRTLTPFLVLLPLLGILIWFIIGRGLRPLTQLTHAVLERTPNSLEPLHEAANTEEIQPLNSALNELLDRLKMAMESQRAFIADAAHELRTPLTALQVQIQLVERADNEAQRNAALTELKAGLQRTTHVIQQLLTLARQDPASIDYSMSPVDLLAQVQTVVVEQQPLAQAKDIDIGVDTAIDSAWVMGNNESVRILLANLIGNAIRYTPTGGKVDVIVGGNTAYYIDICDTGPGIPDDEKQRVFDRFYRRPGNHEAGSGLGLSIVKSIAMRLQATVTLQDNHPTGLCARVEFPTTESPSGENSIP